MDQRKALFRAKLREAKQKREKRIDSPLIKYNEYDQPICRVCNITLKSESLWPAHQVSRKHHEAIENLRAAEAGGSRGNNANNQQPAEVQKAQSSTLPADLFDSHGTKRKKNDAGSEGRTVGRELAGVPAKTKEIIRNEPSIQLDQIPKRVGETDANKVKGTLPGNFFDYMEEDEAPLPRELSSAPGNIDRSKLKQVKKGIPDGFFDSKDNEDTMQSSEPSQFSKTTNSSETKQAKGALPEGFFDNKDADLRARGIQPVKVDVNDAYKEFEKEIQEDLREVDDRLEEEEIDAAVEREEFLTLEQQEYKEKVDMVKKQIMESKAARIARANNKPTVMAMESSSESSSDEDDDDVDFAVDWRAQHLK